MICRIALNLKDDLVYRTVALVSHDRRRVGQSHAGVVGVFRVATPSELLLVDALDSGNPVDSTARWRFEFA